MDWDAALEAFARYLEVERAYSPKTVEVYLRDVRALREHLREQRGGEQAPGKLSAHGVRGQLAALFGSNDAATIGRKLSSVRAFCRFLVKRGVLEGNPAAAIRGPKRKRGLPRALDVDDAFRLVEAPSAMRRTSARRLSEAEDARHTLLRLRDVAMLELLYGTGLRVAELCALDTTDIDRGRYGVAMLIVRRGKGNKSRQVPIGGAADRALAAYLPARAQLASESGNLSIPPLGRSARRGEERRARLYGTRLILNLSVGVDHVEGAQLGEQPERGEQVGIAAAQRGDLGVALLELGDDPAQRRLAAAQREPVAVGRPDRLAAPRHADQRHARIAPHARGGR